MIIIKIIAISLLCFLLLTKSCVYWMADPRGILSVKQKGKYLAYSYLDSGGGGPGYCNFGVSITKLGGKKFFNKGLPNEEVLTINNCSERHTINWSELDGWLLNITCDNAGKYPNAVSIKDHAFGEISIDTSSCKSSDNSRLSENKSYE